MSQNILPLLQAKMTPMLQQYLSIKNAYQHCLLLYRLGDFYELFFEDAVIASSILDITLTKRGQQEDAMPMCGVPYHASNIYIERLVKAGHRVAICEQLETPSEAKSRGSKSIVRREVVRIITAGTLMEDPLLSAKNSNYLASISLHEGKLSIAWAEITTGEFNFTSTTANSLSTELSRLNPSEIIISEKAMKDPAIKFALQEHTNKIVVRPDNLFASKRAEKIITDFYALHSLQGLSTMLEHEISAIGALIEYLHHTHKQNPPRLNLPKSLCTNHFMAIDAATRKNLEIDSAQDGSRKYSLRGILDRTLTASGGRLLGFYLSSPLTNPEAINNRLDAIDCLCRNEELRNKISEYLTIFPDIERASARIFAGRGNPKDLHNIKIGLQIGYQLSCLLLMAKETLSINLKSQIEQLSDFQNLMELLDSALLEEIDSNNFIKPGFNPQFDKLKDLRDNSSLKLTALQNEYRTLTTVANLKITKNNIIGYFIEVPTSQSSKVTDSQFIHKQTLGTSARFTTEALREMEVELSSCDLKITALEASIFEELRLAVCAASEQISLIAQAVAVIDTSTTLAQLSAERSYTRPVVDNSETLEIVDGKHPVVAMKLGHKFMVNNLSLNRENHTWLITGPNMAGKSTFLRQNALICIMAQIGCFVPAAHATIGVVDKLFSRIGAGDDISRGQSTFMVEMSETAAILNNATRNSLIILDEIGRGTATFDGLSIAWSVIEYIHQKLTCRTLFATHYHELVELEKTLPTLSCHTMQVREWEDTLVFMHKIIAGSADRSYGIHVAELAGVPKAVSKRAKEVLAHLEQQKNFNTVISTPTASSQNIVVEEIISFLQGCDIDALTPRAAFDILYQLKSKV